MPVVYCPSTVHHVTSLAPHPQWLPCSHWGGDAGSIWSHLCCRLNLPCSLHFFSEGKCSSPTPSPVYLCIFCTEGPEPGCSTQTWLNECWLEGDNHLPHLCYVPVNIAQVTVSLLCCWPLLSWRCLHLQLLFCIAARQSVPSLCHCRSFFLPKFKTLHLSLLNFTRLLSSSSSSLSWSL